MTRGRLVNIIKKEWQIMFTDPSNLLLVTLLPFLIIAEPVVVIWLVNAIGSEAILGNSFFQNALEKLGQAFPAVRGLAAEEQLQVYLLSQINFFILLIPTMIAISFATFSIVEEKLSKSLEALLATPVRTWELLLGKALSGAIPALLMTWVCAAVFVLAVFVVGWGQIISYLLNPVWLLSIFLLAPGIAVLSFLFGVIGSSRAKDPRNAQNLVIAIILPVFALIASQITGLVWFTPLTTMALALGIVILDIFVLRMAVRLFQRESIVVRWQ